VAVNPVDWTVDKLLGFMRDINTKAAAERAKTATNRSQYNSILIAMRGVPEGPAKQKVRDGLTTWIHKQVDVENRVKDFTAKWAQAKLAVKNFLQQVSITPPDYLDGLDAVPLLVPAAVLALALAAAAIIAWVVSANQAQNRSLSLIADGFSLVKGGQATPEQVAEMMNAANAAAGPKDPLGLKPLLDAAVPVGLIVLAIILVPRFVRTKAAA
jgi:hypothetical protein